MLPKLNACREALPHGVKRVRILPAEAGLLPDLVSTRVTTEPRSWSHERSRNLDPSRPPRSKLLLHTYERNPLLFVSGEGVYLATKTATTTSTSSAASASTPSATPTPPSKRPSPTQSKQLIHTSNLFFHPAQAELALRLTEITGLDRVFFCNSGTEAWEAALKVARAYAGMLRSDGKQSAQSSSPSSTASTAAPSARSPPPHKEKYREPFMPVMPGVEFVRFNDVADLRAKFSNEVCGILHRTHSRRRWHPSRQPGVLPRRTRTLDSTGALLIADEIQSGLGRTGKWFAYQHYGILPDVTTLAKPIASGIPMGAMLCTEAAARSHSLPACTAQPSAESLSPALSPSPSSTRSKVTISSSYP